MSRKVKNLAKHNRVVHSKSEREKKYVCLLCSFSNAYRHKLESHFETHTKPKFTCKLCYQSFNTRVVIGEHVRKSHKDNKDLSLLRAWWTEFVSVFCTTCSVEEDMHEYEKHLAAVHNLPSRKIIPERIKKIENRK